MCCLIEKFQAVALRPTCSTLESCRPKFKKCDNYLLEPSKKGRRHKFIMASSVLVSLLAVVVEHGSMLLPPSRNSIDSTIPGNDWGAFPLLLTHGSSP
jgi:hypothetical protein